MLRTLATRIVRLRATTIHYNKRPCSCSSIITTQLRLFLNEKDAIFIAKSLVRSLSVSAADDTDTTRPPPTFVYTWVQLYRGDQKTGHATRIRCKLDSVIDELTELVKEKLPNDLKAVDPIHLAVYPPDTPLDALNVNAPLRRGGPVPNGTTDEQPLMVMAPSAAAPLLDEWDFTRDIAKAHTRRYHKFPSSQPRELIGRQAAEEIVKVIARQNYTQRQSIDHGTFGFLVASGHVRSGKTRIGIETPRLLLESCKEIGNADFAEPVYLKIDFLNGAKFNSQFDRPELSFSEALGARLMNAFYDERVLKKATHTAALEHIIRQVRLNSMPETVVPIVIHFDEHGAFIADRNKAFMNTMGMDCVLSMLREIGSAATTEESVTGLGKLHAAGHYFIVPITTGTSHISANFDSISRYLVKEVPLPVLNLEDTICVASHCLALNKKLSKDKIDKIKKDRLFMIALGDTGGLPGLIYYACMDADKPGAEYIHKLHNLTAAYISATWNGRWPTLVSVFLARPEVNMIDILEADYTVKDAIDSGSVFLRNSSELGLAPALLNKFSNDKNQEMFHPLLVKTLTKADQWTWQDFEKAHMLYLAATMAAIIREQERFSQITLGTFLRSVQPETSRFLSCQLCLPKTFNAVGFTKQTRQCIPRSDAKPGRKHGVCTDNLSEIFQVAPGTPIIDSFLNINLETTAPDQQCTTLFIQHKHSGLESATSAISVSMMNNEVQKLAKHLAQCGWSEHQEWIFLWVTNREVVKNEVPHDKLLWVSRAELMDHAPLLGTRGLVPTEVLRPEE